MGLIHSSLGKQKITFHENRGEDIVFGDEYAAARMENTGTLWSNGLVFSSEPIRINQKIYFKLVVVSRNSHDVVSVGFTSQNPAGSYSNSEIQTNSRTCSLSKYFCFENMVIYFFVDSSGVIHYGRGIEPEHKMLNDKVDVGKPFWAVLHIWKEPTSIKLLTHNEVKDSLFKWDKVDVALECEEARERGKIVRDVGSGTDRAQEDNEMCIICFTDRLQVVFVPCGHLCSCWKCGQWVQNHDNLCPICREPVGSVVRVYKS